jgi:monoamine oxidase
MINERFFEDYVVGARRKTLGRTITETDFVVHAGHSGDFFPHHMDAEWCKSQAFGQRIAHGTMIFTIGVGLTANEINPAAFSYGYDRLKFIKPVFIGDTIHVEVVVSDKQPEPERAGYGRVIEATTVFNQTEQPVLYCNHIHMVKMQDGQA